MFLDFKIPRVVLLLLYPFALWSQPGTIINLANPSFEGFPGAGIDVPGWINCGPAGETPPDLQPGFFGVMASPRHGETYLGLVVRQTGTWESVGQRLSQPLEKGQCYEFSLDLRRDTGYTSPVGRDRSINVRFTTPVRVIVWGGNGYCDKGEVLYQSSVIIHPRWLKYNCRMSPKKGSWSHIIIEAYYGSNDPFNPTLPLYTNGNVLIDNATPIKQVTCGPEPMPETTKRPVLTKKGPVKPTPVVKPKVAEKPVTPPKRVKRGKTYRLDVYFKADEYTFDPNSSNEKVLDDLYNMLRSDERISVEIGGHTNNLLYPNETRAMELSTSRAKSVAEWLISKGVPAERVQYKGYGWTKPVEPNTSPEGRRRNQRVEVTIFTYEG